MIDKLLAMPRAQGSADGYSIVPVHAWSHDYADVVKVASALQASGGVDVVLPSELMRRVSEHVWSVSCTCDTPGKGTAGHNRYTCSDGTSAYCASDEGCFTTLAFAKGDWRSGCGHSNAERRRLTQPQEVDVGALSGARWATMRPGVARPRLDDGVTRAP